MRLFLIFLSFFFLTACALDTYEAHFSAETHVRDIIASWSYETRDYTLWTLPDPERLRAMTDMLQYAKDRIWIEVYILSEKSIIAELVSARERGVDVRVILERNVYGMPYMNNAVFQTLHDADIPIVWANNGFFTFTHAKFILIDSVFIISTGNLSASTFSKNREFLIVSKNEADLAILASVFQADFERKKIFPESSVLVFSPTDARTKILAFLDATDTSLDMSMQSLTDPEILERLRFLAEKWVQIRICLAENSETEAFLLSGIGSWTNIAVGTSKNPYIHAKALVSDTTDIFVGSMNFTTNALDNNREVGVIFQSDRETSALIRDSLHEDCGL